MTQKVEKNEPVKWSKSWRNAKYSLKMGFLFEIEK